MTDFRAFFRTHPLLSVLLAASAVRLLAVFWSQGFIHSDDHFDTISVAWSWFHDGFWGADGQLRWKQELSDSIGRFPLYNLFLTAQMEFCRWLGISSLSDMMYVVRAVHAALSLLPVWAGYRLVESATRSTRWAVAAGLILACHFALPFLGVRNLIEAVGGSLWMAAVWCLCRYLKDGRTGLLYLAGIWCGLAWMIRFQIAFAALPVPLLLWWSTRRLRPALHFSLAVAVMLVASGLADWALLGRFAGSTLTNISMNAGLDALYRTIPLLYVALLLLFLVPPVSPVVAGLMLRPRFISSHAVLFWTSMSFLVLHSLHSNQQERFIFPIVPAFLVLGVLAVHDFVASRSAGKFPVWLRRFLWSSAAVNLVLLAFFTFAYGHRGMIEPLKWFETEAPAARVLFLQPEVKRWVPIEYAGDRLRYEYVRKWESLEQYPVRLAGTVPFDYFVVYPKSEDRLEEYLDSLTVRFGPLVPVFQVEPSYYDETLHRLNRSHNDNFAAFVFRPAEASP